MITELAKMGTGLMVRGGVGLFLRMVAFAAMSWAVWQTVVLRGVVPFWEWAHGNYNEPLVAFSVIPLMIGIVVALTYGCNKPWGIWDFLRRVPFVCWCLITDDGNDVPLWAILIWPVVALVEIPIALIALPCWGLWLVVSTIGCALWRVLSIRPLDRRK